MKHCAYHAFCEFEMQDDCDHYIFHIILVTFQNVKVLSVMVKYNLCCISYGRNGCKTIQTRVCSPRLSIQHPIAQLQRSIVSSIQLNLPVVL